MSSYYYRINPLFFTENQYIKSNKNAMGKIQNQIFSSYQRNPQLYDEIYDKEGEIKEMYSRLFELYGGHTIKEYVKLNDKAKSSFFNQGITFQVYGDKNATEKIFPFDLFPRIIDQKNGR